MANPQCVYGSSKLAGEQAVATAGTAHAILRTSWVFGAHGGNFLKTILRLANERDQLSIVAGQIGAPTPASLLANVTAHIIQQYRRDKCDFPSGLYHLSCSGSTSWYEYAQLVVELAATHGFPLKLSAADIQPIPTSGYPTPARRPRNSQLDCSKIQKIFGTHPPDWHDSVKHVLAQLDQR
ncbi:SDR family oxidoreductase [Vogesella facilis]|uniref:dTDP-4-dehydrorhamnose reductase n=1 Tax=Vogesella facilis TaxID=1655232 RepID=A0ABV7RE62_9NEIS